MASLFDYFLLLSSFLFFISHLSTAKTVVPYRPRALILPVSKDKCTGHYITQINQRTPLVPVKLTVDLGANFTWINCEEGYVSSSFKPVSCKSAVCSLYPSPGCTDVCLPDVKPCYNNTCSKFTQNRIQSIGTGCEIGQDIVTLHSFNGKNADRIVSVPNMPFVCGISWLLSYLADGVTGMAGLGRANISLPAYFSKVFGFPKKFALCLSSSPKSNGAIIFGDGPYSVIPDNLLMYTPLVLNPTVSPYMDAQSPGDYFIGVKSIRIDDKEIKFNKTLLSIDKDGFGGTMISTINPYTVLHTSIYKSVVKAFVDKVKQNNFALSLLPPPVTVPFKTCYLSAFDSFLSDMPEIRLVLGSDVIWKISGSNSMVKVGVATTCLAILDGGSEPRTSIVIGGHQLEDNLLQFDLASSTLGFSNDLLSRNSSCSHFNFN